MNKQSKPDELDEREDSQLPLEEKFSQKEVNKDPDSNSERMVRSDQITYLKDSPPSSLQNSSKKASSNDFEMKVAEVQELMEPSLYSNSGKKNSLLISVDDSVRFPSVILQHSPKSQKSIKVKIPMYKTTTFMKIETQIFILEVTDPNIPKRQFQIERRYSQFIELYEALFYNQPGFILCPFPDKNFSSFFKIKLGLSLHQNTEKVELIEKRMSELERFINYITHHYLLRNSDQIQIFLQEDKAKFMEGMQRIQRYAEENQQIEQPSQMKAWIGKGKYFWSTYVKKEREPPKKQHMQIGLHDIEFTQIEEKVVSLKNKVIKSLEMVNQLFQAERSFSQFTDFKTENDIVLKLCAKQSSSRQYCKKFANLIEIKILDSLNFNLRSLAEAEKVIQYRKKISSAYSEAKAETDGERKLKIGRRIEVMDSNFFGEWEQFQERIIDCTESSKYNLEQYWKQHKGNMRKVWRKKN